ncbi:MAG: hypothetical protein SWH61_04125 [Thermodesulfobacteriota bacterium]|nr:hypothetical protein [Thermodesulfobacteriota bacterium]
MSGISNIGYINGAVKDVTTPEKQIAKTNGFQDAMKEAVSAGRSAADNLSIADVDRTLAVKAPSENTGVSMVQKTEHLLDLMDYYARGLANPEKSLKDLEPIAVSMKENANELIQQTRSGEVTDDTLHKIAKATALTANVEYAKFSRGDYI